jgi:YD repeat-containing protein
LNIDSSALQIGIGRRTGVSDPSGSVAFGYDDRGRLTEKTSTINNNVKMGQG